ncbi:hypothetical protein AMJ85_05035 [candidate division BRC1 bacterium SM23_51]|nr:MAG: hypothetical protein AMJ85_05035 [candidate division BRC1 bacterium SM23_51]
MAVVWLRRAGGRVQVRKALETALSLDPVTNEPELVGREIRNRLSEAGIRENRCVICVPLKWALTLRTDLPELSEEDIASFLNVQAERAFPFAPEDLSVSVSRYRAPGGAGGATVAAIPLNRLTVLQRAFKAAKLRPLSITLGITSLRETDASSREGAVTLLVGEDGVDLAVSVGGGIAALRSLGEAIAPDREEEDANADTVARQMRITLGQLPQDLANTVRTVRIFGPAHLAEPLAAGLESAASRLRMTVEIGNTTAGVQSSEPDALRRISPGALGAATQRLLGRASDFEFLPPRSSRFKQMTGRVSSRATRWLATAAAALVLALVVAFLYQHVRLSRLESEWKAIEPRVKEIAAVQEKVRQFRPWFDDSARSLTIARCLTEAFPEDGTVWAKTVEIKELPDSGKITVSCSGKAQSNREWLRMLERLRETNGVEDLRFQQVRGENPLQFTLSFRWNTGEANGD